MTEATRTALVRVYKSAVINEARAHGWPCDDFGEATNLIPRDTFRTLRDAFAAQIAALGDGAYDGGHDTGRETD